MWTGMCRLAAGGTVLLAAAIVAVADGGPMASVRARVWPGGSARDGVPVATAAAPPRTVRAEGRVTAYPGARVAVGSEIAGRVSRVRVAEKTVVRAGDVLVELDDDEARAAVAEAEGRVAEAEAGLRWAENDAARQDKLRRSAVGTEQGQERAAIERDAAVARLRVARATLARLQAAHAKARIAAPIDGTVLERRVEPGEIVVPATPLVTIADLTRLRVEAEVDEFDAGRIVVGAEVAITAEGFPGRQWRGRVEEVPDAVGPRRMEPQDPGRPTDTRVLRVKVALPEPGPFKLGQRVEVELETAGE